MVHMDRKLAETFDGLDEELSDRVGIRCVLLSGGWLSFKFQKTCRRGMLGVPCPIPSILESFATSAHPSDGGGDVDGYASSFPMIGQNHYT
jgi:hypothetical protein